jgi:hypothetical protein
MKQQIHQEIKHLHKQINLLKRPNLTTTSQYRGVGFIPQSRNWQARIYRDGRQHNLGFFDVEEDAAEAYNAAALEKEGQALLNFAGQQQGPGAEEVEETEEEEEAEEEREVKQEGGGGA